MAHGILPFTLIWAEASKASLVADGPGTWLAVVSHLDAQLSMAPDLVGQDSIALTDTQRQHEQSGGNAIELDTLEGSSHGVEYADSHRPVMRNNETESLHEEVSELGGHDTGLLGTFTEEQEEQARKLFDRYDLVSSLYYSLFCEFLSIILTIFCYYLKDDSGTVNAYEEAMQMTTNICFAYRYVVVSDEVESFCNCAQQAYDLF